MHGSRWPFMKNVQTTAVVLLRVAFWLFTMDRYRSQAEAARTDVRLMIRDDAMMPTRFAQDVQQSFNRRSPAHA